MRLTLLVVTRLAAAGSGACLEVQGPLDAMPSQPPDPRLIGTWRCLSGEPAPDEAPATMEVQVAPDGAYAVRFQEDGGKPERYRAWASETPAGRLLNVEETGPAGGDFDWVLVRHGLLRPDVLAVEVVSGTGIPNSRATTEEARKLLEARKADPALFETYCVCVKAKSS
jgi:hypothetical protein